MGPTCRHSGKIGIISTVFLMFSIVLFMACMFMLLTLPSFSSGNGVPNPLELGKWILNYPDKQNDVESDPVTLDQALIDIQEKECIVIYRNMTDLDDSITNIDYEKFLSEADKRKVIFIHQNGNVTWLLIPYQGSYFYWIPE